MSDVETWGIVLRDRASGAEQWVACEVTRDGDIVTARAHGYGHRSVEGVGRLILQHDRSLALVCIATPAKYAAHMEGVCLTLAIDEANDLRAEVAQLRASIANREEVIADLRAEATRLADTIGAIGRRVCAESCERDVILDAIREREANASRRGAEAMREMAAGACAVSATG